MAKDARRTRGWKPPRLLRFAVGGRLRLRLLWRDLPDFGRSHGRRRGGYGVGGRRSRLGGLARSGDSGGHRFGGTGFRCRLFPVGPIEEHDREKEEGGGDKNEATGRFSCGHGRGPLAGRQGQGRSHVVPLGPIALHGAVDRAPQPRGGGLLPAENHPAISSGLVRSQKPSVHRRKPSSAPIVASPTEGGA